MDWPVPEFDEKQVREKEREAAEAGEYSGPREFDCVAKMYERLGNRQRAIDCYKLAQRPTKAQRVGGERVYDIEETLSLHGGLKVPEWSPWSRGSLSGLADKENFPGRLYATLGDPYLAIVTYLDAGVEPPFDCWRRRNEVPDSNNGKSDNRTRWFFKPPEMYPTLGKCGWNAEWTADLAERDGKHEIAAKIRTEIGNTIREYLGNFDYCDSAYDSARNYLEEGKCELAVRAYKTWHTQMQYSDIQGSGLFLGPVIFYTAGDISSTLSALEEWRHYIKEHPGETRSHADKGNNLSRLEVLALWRLGRIEEAANCFETIIRNAASQNIWKNDGISVGYSYYDYEFDLSALATLRGLGGDVIGRDEALYASEFVKRAKGYWDTQVKEYYFREMYDEMERVCREEDELDVAAHLYERAGKTDDAARILEEIAGISATPSVEEKVAKTHEKDERSANRKCPACCAEVPSGDKFCGDCGRRLERVCPNCGGAIEGHKKFCGKCGAKIS